MTRPSRLKDHLLIFIPLFTLLLIAYWPLFTGYFLFNDDAFMWEMRGSCRTHPQFYYFLMVGRPFFPLVACPLWSFVHTVNDLNIGRFINVSMLSLSAFLFCNWLRHHSIRLLHALPVTLTIFVLPTFQTQVDLVNSFPHTIGLLASIVAGFMACRGAEGMTDSWRSVLNRYTFLTAVLLFFSMGIYTPLATFYFAVIAVPLILSTTPKGLENQKQLYLFGVFLITAFIYFLFSKLSFSLLPSLAKIPVDNWHRMVIVKDLRWKIPVFFKAMYVALNLWNMPPIRPFASATAVVLLLGAAAGLVDLWRRTGLRALFKGLPILFLFPMAVLPNLAAESRLISYRMISALCALVVLALFFAIRKLCLSFFGKSGSFTVGLVFLFFTLLGVLNAQSNLRHFIVRPAHAELESIKSVLKGNDWANIQAIHVVRPSPGNFLSASRPYPISDDEFGLLTSAFPQLVPGLVRCALQESGLKTDEIERIKISSGLNYPNKLNTEHTLMIEMQKLYDELAV